MSIFMPMSDPISDTIKEPTPDQNINALVGIFGYLEGMTFVKAPKNTRFNNWREHNFKFHPSVIYKRFFGLSYTLHLI
jgi:hypothetical protein